MTNGEFVDDKKIKDILTYISGMKHAEQIIRVKIDKQNNNKFFFASGSLESNIVNDVIDVLEGTRQSFNKRHDKYDIAGK